MIKKIIKSRRAILKLKQQDLAELSGISLRTVKAIEAGKANPSLETLQKIAEVLGMEIRLVLKTTGGNL